MVLAVFDSSEELSAEDMELIEKIQSALIELYNDGKVEEIVSHYPEEISIDKWVLK